MYSETLLWSLLSLTFSNTQQQGWLSLFILGAKYGVCQLFNIGYVGNTHLFPISMVATSYGVCNIFARGASILAPLVAELKPESISKWSFSVLMMASLAVTTVIRDPKRQGKVRQSQLNDNDRRASWRELGQSRL